MNLTITNETEHTLTPLQQQLVSDIAQATLKHEQKNLQATVDVTIVSNDDIRAINHEHRGINKVTDVLSFPMINFELDEDVPSTGEYLLGDIVFSYDKAMEQADEYGHSLDREIGFFIAHSMLHLLGYDHMTPDEEAVMMTKQEAILNSVGLVR